MALCVYEQKMLIWMKIDFFESCRKLITFNIYLTLLIKGEHSIDATDKLTQLFCIWILIG